MTLTGDRDRTLVWTAPLLVLMCAAAVLAWGAGEAGVRVVIRATARTSALLLVLAISSWSIASLAPRRASLVRSLAVSHGLHLVAVLWLGVLTSGDNLRARASLVTLTGGVLAYVVIAVGAVRPRHPFVEWGLVWVAVVFLGAYGPRAVGAPWVYGPAVVLLLAGIALRIAGPLMETAPARRPPKEDPVT